jgi:large subunit ribosomal protein L1
MWEASNCKMAEIEQKLKSALAELRKEKARKFDQSVDFIINLQKFDVKRNSVNIFVAVPHKVKDKKICAFLEVKNPQVDTIIQSEFKKYADKKQVEKLIKGYDFFISQASLMPQVATNFGRALGPSGKMPSPQLGILMNINDKELDALKKKINNSVKIRTKEPSIKVCIGKQSMKDEEIVENAATIYNAVMKVLPRNKENIKNLELKFSMTKPQKIRLE